ncbi:MAG: hypothetical protein JST70_07580 [Bacteroidetes bacterium]|nr:hypothetical protein [Bacteroidota bacterium]
MKRSIIILSAFCLLAACTTQKKAKYEFPEAMQPSVRAGFKEICDKGQVLYNITCAGCHNVKVKGKEKIPDFTLEQLKGYEIRITNAQHESSMPDEKVTAEELGQISTFLMYKKKSGVPFKKKDS